MTKLFYLVLMIGLLMVNTGISLTYGDMEVKRDSDKLEEYKENQIIVVFNTGVTEEQKTKLHNELKAISFKKSYGNYFHVVTIVASEKKHMIARYTEYPIVKFAKSNYGIRRDNRIIGAIKRESDTD